MSGIMSITGEPEGSPVRAGPSIVDITTGIYAALAIVSSLYGKTQGGGGKRIEVPMLASALSLVADRIALYSLTGVLPQRLGSGHPAFEPYRVFKTKDGYVFIGCSNDGYWEIFCKAMDIVKLMDDARFRTNDLRLKNRVELKGLIEQTLAEYSTKEILDRIGETGMPHSPVNTFEQLVQDPHVLACSLIQSRRRLDWKAGDSRFRGRPRRWVKRPKRPCLTSAIPGKTSKACAIARLFEAERFPPIHRPC
jgi:CoA:oxalate CoA-transferase